MGDTLFQRTLRVEVYSETGTSIILGPSPDPEKEDLHISFDVSLRTRGEPNEAKINIYNLSPTTRNIIREDGAAVRLFAGYAGNADKIYEGTIITPVSNPDGPVDMITEIVSGDGYRQLDRTYFSKSYGAGTPVLTILSDIGSELGLPTEIDPIPILNDTLLRGRSFDNKAKRVLKTLCNEFGLQWKIDFGILKINAVGENDPKSPTAVVLNETSGLIGTPSVKFERYRDYVSTKKLASGKLKDIYKNRTRRRVVARSLLNPALRPGRLVTVESNRFVVETDKKFKQSNAEIIPDGVYLIDEARFSGDNFGGDFDVEVTGYGNE